MVGMGAVLAGAAHAPMTATLLLFEMTQDYDILLPTLLATGISTIVSRKINPESVYTAPLAREGVRLREGRDVNLMEAVRVEEAMVEEWIAVEADLPIAELGDYFDQQGVDSLLVVDDRGELLGAVTTSSYRNAVARPEASGSEVGNIMTTTVATIHPDQTLNDAFLLMSASSSGLVPVVPRPDGRRILGILRQGDLIRAYRSALARKQELARRVRIMQLASGRREAIVSLTVPEGNGAADWELGELGLDRHQALVISVRRGGRTIIPRGDTKLQAGDVLTVAVEDEESLSAVRDLLLYGAGLDPSQRTDRAQFAVPTQVHWSERRVRDMHLRGDVLLVRIRRGNRTIIPHGDTILQPGDTVEAVGKATDLAELGTALQEPNRQDVEPPGEK